MNIHDCANSCECYYDSLAKLCHGIYQNGYRHANQALPTQLKTNYKNHILTQGNTKQSKRMHVKLKVNKVTASRQVVHV